MPPNSLTPQGFARAVDADLKWVANTARLLGRALQRTEPDARRFAIVRILSRDFGLPLDAADRAATVVLAAPTAARTVTVRPLPDAPASLVIDAARLWSGFVARLSTARTLDVARRRGRPFGDKRRSARDAARHFGIDIGTIQYALAHPPGERLRRRAERFAPLLRGLVAADIAFVVVGAVATAAHGIAAAPDALEICAEPGDALAAQLAAWDAYPRNVPAGAPFFMDARTLRVAPELTLDTTLGPVHVTVQLSGVGSHAAVTRDAVLTTAFGVDFLVLRPDALASAARASSHPDAARRIAELVALRTAMRYRVTRATVGVPPSSA